MFKNVFTRFKTKKATSTAIDRDTIWCIYRILQSIRVDIVESFYLIKDRRLREVYDNFAIMMLKFDKVVQFLRRILNEDLYAKYPRLNSKEVEDMISKLPIEIASTIRSLTHTVKLLKEFAAIASAPYINSIIKSVSSIIDEIVKYLDKVVD